MPETTVQEIASTLRRHPTVTSIDLAGSRARGTATPYSDWDFIIETKDFARLKADISELLAPHRPLAVQWDRLSSVECCMLFLRGPGKVDLIFPAVPHTQEPAWSVGPDTLGAIDLHFWDWTVWLIAKQAGEKHALVESELRKVSEYLLRPLGVSITPKDSNEAVQLYLAARDVAEQELNVRVSRELQTEVSARLRSARL